MLASAAQYQDWNYALADREFKLAVELAPTNSHEPYGFYLLQIGRQEEGLEEARLALQLNPLCHGTQESVAQILWAPRRYDEALALARTAADGAPSFVAGEALEGKRQYAAAAREFSRLPPSPAIRGHLAHAYALTGRVTEAKRILRELEDSARDNSTGAYEAAFIYAALSQNDRAFEWLDKAFEQRDTGLVFLKIDPCFDVVRDDSRFKRLLRRVGLPQ
jgi:tetratricopeptide (TPR) repeat protein